MSDLCVLHANCQGTVLTSLLARSPAFAQRFRIRHYVNYTREPIDPKDLASCALFLYQNLDASFGNLASDVLLAQLAPSCQAIQIPNLFFKGYWPFWYNAPEVINFANFVLERLLSLKLDIKDIVTIYLKGAHPAFAKSIDVAQDSIAREYDKQKGTPFAVAEILDAYWQKEQLFYTVNHPGIRLSRAVANTLLSLLDLPTLTDKDLTDYVHPYGDFTLPIHPIVGSHLKLPFTGTSVRYTIYHKQLTHKEFVLAYLACRLNKIIELPAYLKNMW